MIDPNVYRETPEIVEKALKDRNIQFGLKKFIELDKKRRKIIVESEELKGERNKTSKAIAVAKTTDKDVSGQIKRMRTIGDRIASLDNELREIESKLNDMAILIPNIPHESVPVGPDECFNALIHEWGEPQDFKFNIKSHLELGETLDLIDLKRGAKIAESRFVLMKGLGAMLERALINLMLDTHIKKGYVEVFPPILVSRESMYSTGQLPKLKDEMYECTDGLFLVPTAEVPVTNIYRNEILNEEELPKKFAAYTPCFRREAGAAGKETKGLIRLHQFNKVELVKISHPDNSYEELESLTSDVEDILQKLALPYRVVALSTGDLSFAAAKCYDLEVWMPSYNDYKEISSCSNFTDFQARRANIRFRKTSTGKIGYVHTLNGSGLAIGRTVAAIFENYQNEDGSISIPAVLVDYMGGTTRIT